MDPISIAVTAAATGAITGTVLNRTIPTAYDRFKEKVKGFFYKRVTITHSQNKMKFFNVLKFVSEFPQFKHSNCSIMNIDDREYEVPIGTVSIPVEGYKIHFDINADVHRNISHVVVSTWKRRPFRIDTKILNIFDTFVKMFPSNNDHFNPSTIATKIIAKMSMPIRFIFRFRTKERDGYKKLKEIPKK